jgi:hypothetical protein
MLPDSEEWAILAPYQRSPEGTAGHLIRTL